MKKIYVISLQDTQKMPRDARLGISRHPGIGDDGSDNWYFDLGVKIKNFKQNQINIKL